MFVWGQQPKPPPKKKPEPVEDGDFTDRIAAFVNLGFDELVALALAAANCSPSDVRERLLKRGATHEQAARAVL